jgi:hypothetical protein
MKYKTIIARIKRERAALILKWDIILDEYRHGKHGALEI